MARAFIKSVNPVGSVKSFAGTSTPSGWLVCDGSAISRSTYANLFSVIGTTWGVGDGSTTFNLPDFQDAFPKGKAIADSIGGSGGANTTSIAHAHTGSTVKAMIGLIDGSEYIVSKNATWSAAATYDYIFSATGNTVTGGAGARTNAVDCEVSNTGAIATGVSSIDNRPAYKNVYYIIKY